MTATKRRTAAKRTGVKKTSAKKSSTKKGRAKKNKLGVKNSLVNNINAKRKKGDANSKSTSTVSKEAYQKMEQNWVKEK